MGLQVGYRVRARTGDRLGVIEDLASLTPRDEPYIGTVHWSDGERSRELLRDLVSAPPPSMVGDASARAP